MRCSGMLDLQVSSGSKMAKRMRMSGVQRREQLLDVARHVFAAKGFDAASMEEIAARAKVSKPVVYEHFGSKDGIYAVLIDREIQGLSRTLAEALESEENPRAMLESATLALLDFIESNTEGFRLLVRDSPVAQSTGSYSSVIGDVAERVGYILARNFKVSGYDQNWASLYAQMLVGVVSQIGQWWLEVRSPAKEQVAAHVVNLVWYGMRGLRQEPRLVTVIEQKNKTAKPLDIE